MQVEPEGGFLAEPLHILNQRETIKYALWIIANNILLVFVENLKIFNFTIYCFGYHFKNLGHF